MSETDLVPIKGFEGLYFINKQGEIYNPRIKRFMKQRLKFSKGKNKIAIYKILHLTKGGKKKNFSVHRLMAQTFLLNPENKPEVNHKDGNGCNNLLSNIEWATSSENKTHAIRVLHTMKAPGLKGEKHPSSKLTEKQIISMRRDRKNGLKFREIVSKYNTCLSNAIGICNGKTWKCVEEC